MKCLFELHVGPTELYRFLRNKAYIIENTLRYPIESFVQLVENVDVLFVKAFDCVKHMTGVLYRLKLFDDSLLLT